MGKELTVVPTPLVCDAWSLCYPLTNGGIEFGFTLLTGSDDLIAGGYQAIRKGVFKASVLSAFLAFQKPITLVGFLERLVDTVIREGRIRQLEYLFVFTVSHTLHGHVDGILWGFIEFVKDDEIGRHGLKPCSGCHASKIKKAVPDAFDVGGVGVFDPFSY